MADMSSDTQPKREAQIEKAQEWFEYVTTTPAMTLDTPFFEVGVRDFVMGEIWSRPDLDTRARRFISLACAVCAGAPTPIQSHMYSALNSGDISLKEMREFVLHVAVYAGWAKASMLDPLITQIWEKIQAQGGPIKNKKPEPLK